jgi:hypothetical protein
MTTAPRLAIALLLLFGVSGAGIGRERRPVKPAAASARDSVSPEQARLVRYSDAVSKPLDRRIRGALSMINAGPRRLLALKYYLQRGGAIGGLWAWTEREIVAYRRSIEYRLANAEVDKVRMVFARQNPGYTLTAQKDARTLQDQVDLWNKTPGIQTAGEALWKTALVAVRTPHYPDTLTSTSVARFRQMLLAARARPALSVALPGFSHHGQLRAYDFVIWRDGKIVAGTDIYSIQSQWIASGWSDRLRQAVYTASGRFDGPLQAPHEPWHYTYLR